MNKSFWKKLLLLIAVVGPGLITSNIDNDAGGIATYSLAGANTGLRLIWILFPVSIALVLVQEMCIRMGIVTGKGLADLIREKFGLKITFYALILLIFADLGNVMAEFAGIAAASEIFGISKYISVPICALLVWLLIVKGDYKVVERIFLVGCTFYIAYIICGIIIKPDWNQVVTAIATPSISSISRSDFPIIVGLIGTTITPWMQFFIQASVVEKGVTIKHIWYSRADVIFGCLLMFIVSAFIMICCASTLYVNGVTVHSAKEAALSLKPLAGEYSSLLFGFGLFNASFFAAALLPLATSYYVCEGLGWESGVDKSFKEAPNFFIIFTTLIVISSVIVLIPEINLFKILISSQVINGVLIPFIIFFIVNLCNDPDIMGEHINKPFYNVICYLVIITMIVTNFSMIYLETIQ